MQDFAELVQKLQSKDRNARYEACEELRVAPSIPPEALAALRAASTDADPEVADAARRAIVLHEAPPSPPMPASRPEPVPLSTVRDSDQSQRGPLAHTVQVGDTLTLIALQYYGPGNQDHWRLIYEANRSVIGDNPYLLEQGMILEIPLDQPIVPGAANHAEARKHPMENLGCVAIVVLPATVIVFNAWKHFRVFGNWDALPFLGDGPSYPGEATLICLFPLFAVVALLGLNYLANRIFHPDTILGAFLVDNPPVSNAAAFAFVIGPQVIVWLALDRLFDLTVPGVQYRQFRIQELILPAIVAVLLVGLSTVLGVGSLQRQGQMRQR